MITIAAPPSASRNVFDVIHAPFLDQPERGGD
jgi:hypothetical protein